jgi:EAL domain-containing protein (putative c-di-GMP-specific phosphodiesterase class I)
LVKVKTSIAALVVTFTKFTRPVGVPAREVTLPLTETLLSTDNEAGARLLKVVAVLWVEVAFDQFSNRFETFTEPNPVAMSYPAPAV